jgi:3-deoxy-D-manno-octulosonic-acid transferase
MPSVLGEVRSAVPLIRALLDQGEPSSSPPISPPPGAARPNAAFAPEIAAGQLAAVWVPFELAWCLPPASSAPSAPEARAGDGNRDLAPDGLRRPRRGVPLFMCNAGNILRNQWPRCEAAAASQVMRRFAGALVKSQLQADRFAAVGVQNITVTGELRFDQPIPPAQVAAAASACALWRGTAR